MPTDSGDRFAIIELINSYGIFADIREAKKQSELFTIDAALEIYLGEPGAHQPIRILRGRQEMEDAFAMLKQYDVTSHFNAQSSVSFDGQGAHAVTYCLAHHLQTKEEGRNLGIMSIRYYDDLVKMSGSWFFQNRKLIIDWTDSRASVPL